MPEHIEWTEPNRQRHYNTLGVWPEQCPACAVDEPVYMVAADDGVMLLVHKRHLALIEQAAAETARNNRIHELRAQDLSYALIAAQIEAEGYGALTRARVQQIVSHGRNG